MSERTSPHGNPAPQREPVEERPRTTNAYAPPEYFARQQNPEEENPSTTNAYAPPEYFARQQNPARQPVPAQRNPAPPPSFDPSGPDPLPPFDPEEERRMTEVYAPPEQMGIEVDAQRFLSAQRLYPQRYETARTGADMPEAAPVYAAPPPREEPRMGAVYAGPPAPEPKKSLLERLFGRRKKP